MAEGIMTPWWLWGWYQVQAPCGKIIRVSSCLGCPYMEYRTWDKENDKWTDDENEWVHVCNTEMRMIHGNVTVEPPKWCPLEEEK